MKRNHGIASPTLLFVLAAFLLSPTGAHAARCLGERATIVGGGGGNVLRGSKAPDVIHGGGGRDRILGRRGNDKICGGAGRDRLLGGRGKDRLAGGGGGDRLAGLRGSDSLAGGPRRDRLFGGSGNDRLQGGGGGDLVDAGRGDDPRVSGGPGGFDNVVGGTGNDRVDGGPGSHDIASYVTTSGSLRLDLGARVARGAEHERLRGFEDALGGSGDDTLVGGPAANRLDGGPGGDSLQASGSADAAFGGPGSDACLGGFAAQNSCGDAGGGGLRVELVESIDATTSLVVTGSDGSDRVSLRRVAGPSLRRAGRVLASMGPGDDVLSVNGVPRGVEATLDGGAGRDKLTGGAGQDTLYAGDDRVADTLAGSGDDDQLFGVNTAHPRKESGPARMLGGGGDDLLVGGQPCGGDRFVGGPGRNDSASFARIRNAGVNVRAKIGGAVSDPDAGRCDRGRISPSTEKIEGSPGRDRLIGDGSADVLLGRGGPDLLMGRGGRDRCVGGAKRDRTHGCEQRFR